MARRHLEDRRKQFDTAERQEHHWKNWVERGEAVIPQKARRLTDFAGHRHIDQSNTDGSADESDKKFEDHCILPTHYGRSAGLAGVTARHHQSQFRTALSSNITPATKLKMTAKA